MDLPPPPPPLVRPAENRRAWEQERSKLRAAFIDALGRPGHCVYTPEVTPGRAFDQPEFTGRLYWQRSGPDTVQRLLVLSPRRAAPGRRPVVIVPFYAPDRQCGYDLATGERLPAGDNRANLALHLVTQGYTVVCGEAYPVNLVPKPPAAGGPQDFLWWSAAATTLARRYPAWTGMGKLYHDARLLLDFALTLDGADPDRIAVMGHSLGGKIAFYLGCLDERIRVTVGSDFGVAWEDSNWEAPWYYGGKLDAIRSAGLNHAQLLALAAPKPFLLIGGQYDLDNAGRHLDAARGIYRLYGAADRIDFDCHGTGHAPSWDALERAYRRLAEQLALPEPDLREFRRFRQAWEAAQRHTNERSVIDHGA